jgi:hypothetical protein
MAGIGMGAEAQGGWRMNMKTPLSAGLVTLAFVVFGWVIGAEAADQTLIKGYGPYAFGVLAKTTLEVEPQFHATTPPEWLRKLQGVMYQREGTVNLGPDLLPQPGSIGLGFVQNHLAYIALDVRGQPAYQPDTAAPPQKDLWHAVRSAILGVYSRSLVILDDQTEGHERMVLRDVWGDTLRATNLGDRVSVQYLIDTIAHAEGAGM